MDSKIHVLYQNLAMEHNFTQQYVVCFYFRYLDEDGACFILLFMQYSSSY